MKIPLLTRCSSRLPASVAGLALLLAASVVHAQTGFFVRGDFNDWDTSFPMTNQGGGLHTYQATGLNPGEMYFFKIANEDWSINWPGSNARVMADSNGEILFRAFDQETWTDGWMPDTVRRVGYSSAGHGWELVGSMTGWDTSPFAMTDMGNGLYRGEVFLDDGSYEYKFRMAGSWDINLGDDFGNSAGNIMLNVPVSDIYVFQLDVMNGRFDASPIPEPSTYALLFGAGVLAMAWLKRRRAAV